jgi:hypothetical protein
MKSIKKSKNKTRNRKNKKTRKNNMVGSGLFSFGKEVAQNIIFEEKKPTNFENLKMINKRYNKTYVTYVTPDSGKEYMFFFITPQTLIFNNINATRVPTFFINKTIKNLKIKNRYVNYLVEVENEWYAILRIVFALNTSFFASYTYTIFYKLNKDVIQFDETENNITINETNYYNKTEFTFGLFKDTSDTLLLKETTYTPITKNNGDIFYALRKFRNVQLESYNIKQGAMQEGFNNAVELADIRE